MQQPPNQNLSNNWVHAITSEPDIDGDELPQTAPDFSPNMQQVDTSQDQVDAIVFDQDFMMPNRCLHQQC